MLPDIEWRWNGGATAVIAIWKLSKIPGELLKAAGVPDTKYPKYQNLSNSKYSHLLIIFIIRQNSRYDVVARYHELAILYEAKVLHKQSYNNH